MKTPRTLFCAAGLALSTALVPAHADTTLYVGMNGGTLEKNYETYIFPAFEQARHVKIMVVPGTSADVLAKMQAQKARPSMQVAFLDDGVMVRAVSMGLCERIADAPVLKDLIPEARYPDNQAVAVEFGVVGIGYNKQMFDANRWPAPDSWAAFADPKYKGKVIFQSIASSTYGLYGLLMVNRILGGTDGNVEPAFSKWPTTVGPNVLEYISNSAQISEMVQNNEAGLFPTTVTQIQTFKEKGLPVAFATPKEGNVKLMYSACMLKGNTEPALAQQLIEYLVSPAAQTAALEHSKSLPVNRTVRIDARTEAQLGRFEDLTRHLNSVDWATVNDKRGQWNDRWNRTIEH
ncbi:MAG: ABC transporter substrate-binding protein [Janthinobacterium lividum]